MKTVQHIRIQLGISIRDFACYLGVSKTMLVKAESGKCTLNTKSLTKLALLVNSITGSDIKKRTSSNEVCPSAILDYCEKRLSDCRYSAAVLLRKMDEKIACAEQLEKLNSMIAITDNDLRSTQWIIAQKNKIQKKLKSCDEATIDELREKIYLLNEEADIFRKYLEEKIRPVKDQHL